MDRRIKIALTGALLAMSLQLTACYIPPDEISDSTTNLTIGSQNLPFQTVAPLATATPTPTKPTTADTIPGGNNGGVVVISPTPTVAINWNNNWGATATDAVSTNNGGAIVVITSTPMPTAMSATATSSGVLTIGSSGSEVRKVQQRLKDLGYYTGSVDGDFGEGTASSVIAFQKANQLTADGKVGPATLARLNSNNAIPFSSTVNNNTVRVTATPTVRPASTPTSSSLQRGSTGQAVRTLQQRLKDLGYYTGSVDGDFGESTEAAVKAFQKANRLTVDGKAGANTLAKLRSGSAVTPTKVPAVTPVKTPAPANNQSSSNSLQNGDSGSEVVRLQQRLADLGFYSGTVDGKFGDSTENAVRAFQRARGLKVDGKAGTNTLAKLYGTATATPYVTAKPTPRPTPANTSNSLQNGASGGEVKKLQQRLKDLGYYSGSVDGQFGDSTENAVRAFQRASGLKVDGKAGSNTLAKLYGTTPNNNNSNNNNAPTATPKPQNTAKPTATPNLTNARYLTIGSSGKDVTRLQTRLISLGYMGGSADGSYGGATQAAVIAFQKKTNGLYDDGIAGPETQEKLFSNTAAKASAMVSSVGDSLRPGDNGSAVRALQKRLKALKYYNGSIDGDFGDATTVAVRAFQQQNGLTVDGIAGTTTLNAIYSSRAESYSPNNTQNNTNYNEPEPYPTASTQDTTSTGYLTLQSGDKGAEVRKLQQKLKDLGYYTGSVDGSYGAGTVAAVKSYQAANNLSVDGKAGPATQRKLYGTTSDNANFSALHLYDEGKAVSAMQYALYELGYFDGRVTGLYNTATADAVRAFQIANHLTVDGTAGSETLQKLYSSTAISATKATYEYKTLKSGDTGEEVVELQDQLVQQGYLTAITGKYDSATVTAVKAFQRANGLNDDGIAGPTTQYVLYH